MTKKALSFLHFIFKKPSRIEASPSDIKQVKADGASSRKQSYLLHYRSSNAYVLSTACFSIFTSIYLNPSFLIISTFILEHHFQSNTQPQLTSGISLISAEWIDYVLSSAYLLGLLVGSVLFGWIGYHTNQRRLPLFSSSVLAIFSSGALILANRYWIMLVSKFFQGFSNCSTWLMAFAMISDIWPDSQLGFMVGMVGCLFPLGLSLGSMISAFYYHVSYQALLFSVLTMCIIPCLLQLFVIEKASIPEEWLQPDQLDPVLPNKLELKSLSYTRPMPETTGKWSKSSSMSTINLNQPTVFEKDTKHNKGFKMPSIKNSILFALFSSGHFMSLLYQIIAISIIIGTLKSALLVNLEDNLNITNALSQSTMTGTFLLPCAISAFVSGWLSDRFGANIISLTSAIICVSAFIWIGVPNQNVQSIASALVLSGITLAGMTASTLVTTIKTMQRILSQHESHKRATTLMAATVCFTSGLGFFAGIFIKNLTDIIGFFWLCFSLGMLLLTCIPWVLYFMERKKKKSSTRTEGDGEIFSQSSSKRSIIHGMRPESFAESILSDTEDDDDEEEEGREESIVSASIKSKPMMVAP